MFGLGKKRENLSINPDNYPEAPAKEGAKIERGADTRSAKEIGAELNYRAIESVKGASSKLFESGKNLWGGLKRIMGSAKEGGKEALGQAKTWAKEGVKGAADLAVGGAYKGGAAAARGVERGAAFVANAPEMALEKTADVLEAGSEWTQTKLEQGGQWAQKKYEQVGGWAAEKVGEIQTGARNAKEGFTNRVNQAVEQGKAMRVAYQESRKQEEITRLGMELLGMEKRKMEMTKRWEELTGINNLKSSLEAA